MGSTRRDASLSLEKDPEQAAEAGSPATTEATFSEAGGVTVAAEQCTVEQSAFYKQSQTQWQQIIPR
jgi:hypothetical protein